MRNLSDLVYFLVVGLLSLFMFARYSLFVCFAISLDFSVVLIAWFCHDRWVQWYVSLLQPSRVHDDRSHASVSVLSALQPDPQSVTGDCRHGFQYRRILHRHGKVCHTAPVFTVKENDLSKPCYRN